MYILNDNQNQNKSKSSWTSGATRRPIESLIPRQGVAGTVRDQLGQLKATLCFKGHHS